MSSLSARLLISVSVLLIFFFGVTIVVLDTAFRSAGEQAQQDILDGHLMAILAIGLGVVLLILSVFTMMDGGWLNAIVGGLAIGIGCITLKAIRTYQRVHGLEFTQ